jgi:hypothetical protein
VLVWEDATGSQTATPRPMKRAKEPKNFYVPRVSYSVRSSNEKWFLFTKNKNVRLFLCAVVETIFTPISTISFGQKKGVAPL